MLPLTDDVVYAILIGSSVLCGPVIHQIKSPHTRKVLCSFFGVLLIAISCGWDALHQLIVTIVNGLLISALGPRKCHLVSFAWCFGYLVFFRTAHLFNLPSPSPVANALQLFNTLRVSDVLSALQLFNTLRMVGLAFEVHDVTYLRKRESETEEEFELKKKYTYIRPSLLDVLCYATCYLGLFTGPYYKYRTYYDMLHQDNSDNIPTVSSAISRVKSVPLVAATYLIFSTFFNITYVDTPEFAEQPFWYRLFYMVPMFTIFRTRLYLAWLFSECMCMLAGLGAYPVSSKPNCGEGPSDFKALDKCVSKKYEDEEYDFETIHCLSIYGCELGTTTREGLRSWNMTVQYWLAACVHRRLPRSYGAGRVAITMGVSAFWHGIHPGYYLSFLTVPPILMAEEAMMAAFRIGKSPTQQKLFDWGCWFFKMRGFDYMCMGFLLLKLDSTLRYWKSIYFLGHVFTAMFLVLGYAFKPARRKKVE